MTPPDWLTPDLCTGFAVGVSWAVLWNLVANELGRRRQKQREELRATAKTLGFEKEELPS